jgi:hypothetical protein
MTKLEMRNAFVDLCNEMIRKMFEKNHDYSRGDSPFKNLERHGLYGITVRLDDKINRLDSLTNSTYASNEASVSDESLEDTCMDMATYALLMILLKRHLKESE